MAVASVQQGRLLGTGRMAPVQEFLAFCFTLAVSLGPESGPKPFGRVAAFWWIVVLLTACGIFGFDNGAT